MFRIPMIQLTDLMKINKKEDPSENTSFLLRRENKMIMGGRGLEGSGWERGRMDGRREWEGRIRQERNPEGQENEWKYAAVWDVGEGKLQRVPETWDMRCSQNSIGMTLAKDLYSGAM